MESIEWTVIIQPKNLMRTLNTTSHKTLEDYNDEESSRRWAVLIYLAVLLVVGTIGNSIVIVVYPLRFPKSNHRTFIVGLAVMDLTVCLSTIPFELYEFKHQYTFFNETACKIFRGLSVWFSLVSMLILLGMSFEKYRKICKPLKFQMSVTHCRIYIICVFISSLLVAWPSMLQSGIRLVHLGNNNITGQDCSLSDKYANTIFPIVGEGVLLVLTILVIGALVIFYSLIGRTVFQHSKFRRQFQPSVDEGETNLRANSIFTIEFPNVPENTRSRKENTKENLKSIRKLTKIAFVVSLVFILSYIPHLVISLLTAIKGKFLLPPGPVVSAVLPIIARSFLLNNIANPIIYGFMDPRFRRNCINIFCIVTCCTCCRQVKD